MLLTAPLRGIPSSRTPSSGGFIRSSSLAGRFGSSTPLGPNRGSASHKEGGIKVAGCTCDYSSYGFLASNAISVILHEVWRNFLMKTALRNC